MSCLLLHLGGKATQTIVTQKQVFEDVEGCQSLESQVRKLGCHPFLAAGAIYV